MFSRGDSEVWSTPVNDFERRASSGAGDVRVQHELCHRYPVDPVVLLLGDEEAQELLYFLVLALDLAVAFRMIGSGQAGLDNKALGESMHVVSGKLVSAVGEDLAWETV